MINELTEDVRTTVAQLLTAYDAHLATGQTWVTWEHDRFFLATEVPGTVSYQVVVVEDGAAVGVVAWEDGDGDEPFFSAPTSHFRASDAAKAILANA